MNYSDRIELQMLPKRIRDTERRYSELMESLKAELRDRRRRCDHRFETEVDARVFEEHVTFCQLCGMELWSDTMKVHEID